MPKPAVIFDLHNPLISSKDLFSAADLYKISHTFLPTCDLVSQLSKSGFPVFSINDYLESNHSGPAYLISYLVSDKTDLAISNGAVPLILACQESPFIATRFYLGLSSLSGKFKHSFVFSGMKRWLSRKSIYHQMFFPEPYGPADFNPKNFSEKKLLTMVSGAKAVGDWKKDLLLKLMYGWRVKEIYSKRLRAAEFFSGRDGFDLYGRGWDKTELPLLDKRIIEKAYRGEVVDKFITLQGYKFTLCFENSIFPGYVTEKIFDAIFAGSVPIYYGAPDIKKYIPAGAFIDFRNFNDYEALYSFISSMSEEKYGTYISAMWDFVNSQAYERFSQEHFTASIISILEDEFNK